MDGFSFGERLFFSVYIRSLSVCLEFLCFFRGYDGKVPFNALDKGFCYFSRAHEDIGGYEGISKE